MLSGLARAARLQARAGVTLSVSRKANVAQFETPTGSGRATRINSLIGGFLGNIASSL
jgi:hypothetical protein